VTQEAAYLAHCQRPVRRADQIITHARQQSFSITFISLSYNNHAKKGITYFKDAVTGTTQRSFTSL
jgi:hypothetical protein